jgi:hypothetical protein
MPNITDEDSPALLNIDSGSTLSGIQLAIEAYARTIPDAAVAKIRFEQVPDVGDVGYWKATVFLTCLGELRHNGAIAVGGEPFLAGIEPTIVHEQHWTAVGMGFAGAVEELRDVIEDALKSIIVQRQVALKQAADALVMLRNPPQLQNMWATSDSSQDEHLAKEEQ